MPSSVHDIPGVHVAQTTVRAHAADAGAETAAIFVAPFDCKIRAVYLRTNAAITGADTNSTNINLVNAGTDGDGTDELANIDFEENTNAAKGALVEFYAPVTPLAADAGTLLVIDFEQVGDGLALPSFLAIVEYEAA